jgi:hypothetical protein
MRPTVRIAFDLSLAGAGDFFTLDDPTKGELDGVGFTLAGDVSVDVSDDVRSVSVRRGRARELTAFSAGQASIVLDNRTRLYDPTAGTAVTPYGPSILPRKAIAVEVGGQALFNGTVEDWDLQYSLGGDSVTTAKASDGFTLLAGETLAGGTATPQLSGARVETVLDEVAWPEARRDISTGVGSLGDDVISDNVTALAYLQTLELSEAGALFVSKDGALTFRDRIFSRNIPTLRFADDGTGVAFEDIELEYGTESLNTRVSVEYVGGTAVADDATAQLNYGVIDLNLKTVLADSTEADDLATFFLERYATPTLRITGLQVNMDGLSPEQQQQVLGAELGDPVRVVFTPNGIPPAISQAVSIDRIEHDISPANHIVRFNFSETFTLALEGSVTGSSTSSGTVVGERGMFGSVTGSSSSSGSVTGVKSFFTLDTDELDDGRLG